MLPFGAGAKGCFVTIHAAKDGGPSSSSPVPRRPVAGAIHAPRNLSAFAGCDSESQLASRREKGIFVSEIELDAKTSHGEESEVSLSFMNRY